VDTYRGALEAVDRILNREPEADDVLRQTVAVLHERIEEYRWVGLYFVDEGELVLGPSLGRSRPDPPALPLGEGPWVPVVYQGSLVGVLAVGGPADLGAEERAFLERVALLVSAHCLVGWDTGGVDWSDVS
jgi:putative methionine-R-sulfoxide reductase with GAF domain